MTKAAKQTKTYCDHDYKNAIQIGNVDYVCPKCKELLDPLEWFLWANFDLVDCTPKAGNKKVQRRGK